MRLFIYFLLLVALYINTIYNWTPPELPNGVITNFSNLSYSISTTTKPTEVSPTTPITTILPDTESTPLEMNPDIWEQVGAETLSPIFPAFKKVNGTGLNSASNEVASSNSTGELPNEQSRIDRILQLLAAGSSDSDKRTIYFGPSSWGGFGNGFRAIRGLALYAVLFQVRLRLEWDNYFDIMSPDVVNALRADRVPSYCYYVQSFDFDGIESLRINTCVAVVDIIDISWRLLSRPQNREVLVRLGLFSSIPTEDEVISLFTRALFRPMITLTYQAKQYYENMRQNHTWIGVQLRTGGLLANTPEQDVFLTKEKIEIMARRIMEFIANQTIASPILFVSSDSSDAIEQMKSLVSIPVYSSNVYKIGHSSPARNHAPLQQVYLRNAVDIEVLSFCDYLITTKDSSFGQIAIYLSNAAYRREWRI